MTAPLELVPTRITARRSWYVRVLTTSSTCVCRTIPGCARWERSPRPVSVGVCTLCPSPASRGTSFFQHQPPNQAECTRTKSAISLPAAMTHSPLPRISGPGSVPYQGAADAVEDQVLGPVADGGGNVGERCLSDPGGKPAGRAGRVGDGTGWLSRVPDGDGRFGSSHVIFTFTSVVSGLRLVLGLVQAFRSRRQCPGLLLHGCWGAGGVAAPADQGGGASVVQPHVSAWPARPGGRR